jgi:tetratricopeptide (TPR) repeat protein
MTEAPPPRWLSLRLDPGAASFFGLPEQLHLLEVEDASVLEGASGTVFLERLALALERAAEAGAPVAGEPGVLRFLHRWRRYADLDRYLRVGNAPFARAVARALLGEDPGDPPPLVALAGLEIDEDRWDDGVRLLALALERAPDHSLVRLQHALALAGGGHREESLDSLDRLSRSRFQSAARFWRYEIAHHDMGDVAERLRGVFSRLPGQGEDGEEIPPDETWASPENPELLYLRALRLGDEGGPGAREELLVRALAGAPEHVPARVLLVRILRETGRAGEALSRVEEGVAERPFASELHAARGQVLEQLGRRDEARDAYRAALDGPLALVPGSAFLIAGTGLLRLGEIAAARDIIEDAIEARPGDPLPHQLLAGMDEAAAGKDAAERRLREAIRSTGRHPVLEYALGDLLRRQGRRLEAEGIMKVLVRRHPRSPWGHRGLGDLALARSPHVALEHYAEALRIDPAFPIPGYDYLRGVFALRAGDPTAARIALEKAAAGDPGSARTWCDLGAACFMEGRIDAALAATERALSLEPGHPGFLHNLAAYHARRFRSRPWRYPLSGWRAWRLERESRRKGDAGWHRDLWTPPEPDPLREEPPPSEPPSALPPR